MAKRAWVTRSCFAYKSVVYLHFYTSHCSVCSEPVGCFAVLFSLKNSLCDMTFSEKVNNWTSPSFLPLLAIYIVYICGAASVCVWMCLCSSMFSQCAYKYEVNNPVSVTQWYMASWRSCGLVTCCCWQLPYGALESHISYCCSTDIWIYVLWDFSITKGQWTIPDWHINSEYQYRGNMKWAPNDVWAKVGSDTVENTACALIFISVTFSLKKQLHFFFHTDATQKFFILN